MDDFKLNIIDIDNQKAINFANNSQDFVEVIFAIDGYEAREGKILTAKTKGYCYPPKLEKPVKKMESGERLSFRPSGGEVVAYIFAGVGKYKDEDLDKPTFLRHQLVSRVKFKRTSSEPVAILKTKY